MVSDKKDLFDFITSLEKISVKINDEIKLLKKKLKFIEYAPKPRKCSHNLLENILNPLFEEKEVISLEDIIKKSGKKKTTLLCYLSELVKHELIIKTKNLKGDKRTRLYKKTLP